jgi:hypothetical protein
MGAHSMRQVTCACAAGAVAQVNAAKTAKTAKWRGVFNMLVSRGTMKGNMSGARGPQGLRDGRRRPPGQTRVARDAPSMVPTDELSSTNNSAIGHDSGRFGRVG